MLDQSEKEIRIKANDRTFLQPMTTRVEILYTILADHRASFKSNTIEEMHLKPMRTWVLIFPPMIGQDHSLIEYLCF